MGLGMQGYRWGVPLLMVGLAWGCAGPALDIPKPEAFGRSLQLEPASDDGSIGVSFRARVHPAPASGQPWLLRGELSDYYERALRRRELPEALRERAVPLRYWRDSEDSLLQPLAWLEPAETYTLAWEGEGTLRTFVAQPEQMPRALQLFPAPGRPRRGVTVLCDLLEEVPEPLVLEPGGVALRSLPELSGLPRAGCVTLAAEGELEALAVAPPVLGGAWIEPGPWLPRESASGAAVPECAGEELGGACAEIADDRILVTPRGEDQLWLLQAPAPAEVSMTSGERGLLLSGLLPESRVELRASVLSSDGSVQSLARRITTGSARRHLVLNEVLANPLGDENSSEWIEVWNDSARPAALGDVLLVDSGGSVALPAVELEPNELALLVPSTFRASGVDVPVPAHVRLVRLASLGTRGLANSGESLLLVGPEGVLSRFPQLAAKAAGHSVARRDANAADDEAAGFGEHGGVGASPGAPNSLARSTD